MNWLIIGWVVATIWCADAFFWFYQDKEAKRKIKELEESREFWRQSTLKHRFPDAKTDLQRLWALCEQASPSFRALAKRDDVRISASTIRQIAEDVRSV